MAPSETRLRWNLRASLTLSDIPNPDGWDLRVEDMFIGDRLAEQTLGKTILLANPPFENFNNHELAEYAKTRTVSPALNKAVEMLRQTLPALQPGSVFGVVIPQTILHGAFAEDVRRYIAEEFELREVSLFPDKVFSFSDAESAVLLGRRLNQNSPTSPVLRFRRIRERQIQEFRETYNVPNSRAIEQSRFNESISWDFRVPDLEEVWLWLANNPRASDVADLVKGLDYRSKDLQQGVQTYSETRFPGARRGYIRLERDIQIHQLPKEYWMNLADNAVKTTRSGTTVDVSQVLVSYARVSRGPWRLKAFVDMEGHPVTSSFITARPHACSLEFLWALLNSPIANAYAFTHLAKRHNLVGDMRKIPIPKRTNVVEIESTARDYLEAARADRDSQELQRLMMQVDAAVLRQYGLPAELESQLLALFYRLGSRRCAFPAKLLFPA